MIEFHFLKHLKKRIRRRRRPLWVLGSIVLIATLTSFSIMPAVQVALAAEGDIVRPASSPKEADGEKQDRQMILQLLEALKEPVTVNQHSIYVCGEEFRPLGRMQPKQVASLLGSHPDWTAVISSDSKAVMLQRHIDDLSDHCKRNAYMGIDKNGCFSMFDGEPSKERVLRTFFQIDVQYMESSLPKNKLDELAQGIRISDIDEYNSVLSTYSDFAMESNEKSLRSMSPGEADAP